MFSVATRLFIYLFMFLEKYSIWLLLWWLFLCRAWDLTIPAITPSKCMQLKTADNRILQEQLQQKVYSCSFYIVLWNDFVHAWSVIIEAKYATFLFSIQVEDSNWFIYMFVCLCDVAMLVFLCDTERPTWLIFLLSVCWEQRTARESAPSARAAKLDEDQYAIIICRTGLLKRN